MRKYESLRNNICKKWTENVIAPLTFGADYLWSFLTVKILMYILFFSMIQEFQYLDLHFLSFVVNWDQKLLLNTDVNI